MKITIPGNPGDAAANAAMRSVARRTKGGRVTTASIKSKRRRAFESMAVPCIRRAISSDRAAADVVRDADAVRVFVDAYWPKRRRLDGVSGLAMGDVDAPVKAVLDMLESAGLFDDDVRCVELIARKFYDKANPRIEVEVTPATWPPDRVD